MKLFVYTFTTLAMCVVVTVLAPSFGFGQSTLTVWVADSLEKIRPDDAPRSNASVTLSAARGEYEPFQLVVRAQGSPLTNVNVTVSDLRAPSNGLISKSNFTLYREHYVYVGTSSPDYRTGNRPNGPGWYPDPLIPFHHPQTGADLTGARLDGAPFSVSTNKNQPVWIDLFVPRNARPGTYTGTVSVTSNQGSATIPIQLTVWSFELPLKPRFHSSFAILGPASEDKRFKEELIRHKVMPFIVKPADQLDLTTRLGLNITALWIWSHANVSNCRIDTPPSVSTLIAESNRHLAGLERYVFSADEISKCTSLFPALKQWARNIHAAGLRNAMTAAPIKELQDDGSGTGRSVADIWVLLPKMFDLVPQEISTVRAKGDSLWSYTALVQDSYSPQWLIDFHPINMRIHPGFISQSLGLSGLLYWGVNNWQSNPWTNVLHTEGGFAFPGEGVLIYPGTDVGLPGPVASMRLKWLREGVEDYEYVALLKAVNRGDWAMQTIRGIASDWKTWTKNPSELHNVRRRLGEELHMASGGTQPPVGTTTFSVSNVRATDITATSATIRWSTSAPGTSQVEGGLTPAAAVQTPLKSALVTDHAVVVSNLPARTTIYFRARSTNSQGAVGISPYYNFRTQ